MANSDGHRNISAAALDTLPHWQQEILIREKEHFLAEYCMYGDSYFTRQKELASYVVLPSGKLPMDPWEVRIFHKEAPGRDFFICGYYELMRETFEYFSQCCIAAARADDWSTFARFLGTIAHVIEDCATPAHAVGTSLSTDFRLIRKLFPPQDERFNSLQFHSLLESNIPELTKGRPPRQLGYTPQELALYLFEEFSDLLDNAVGFIFPLLSAFYVGDMAKFRKLMGECMSPAAAVVADFIFSTINLGRQTVELPKTSGRCFLNELTPQERNAWATFPYAYAELRGAPYSLDHEYRRHALTLKMEDKKINFSHGFGCGVPFYVKYQLPRGNFTRLEAMAGLSAIFPASIPVDLKIIGDGRALWAERLPIDCSALSIKLDITTIQTLEIKAEPPPPFNFASQVHLVLADPQLS